MQRTLRLSPVVKWAGGKRQLLKNIAPHIPEFTTYYEPFAGGCALLFALKPQRAVVNDFNAELINAYCVIKDQVDALILCLQQHKNEPLYYYKLRELDRDRTLYAKLSAVERAARLLYLNKTCFNGLFRVNRAGEFNSPFGYYKNPNLVHETNLRAVSDYFNAASIVFKVGDFAAALQGIQPGAFVYFDPPYDPLSASANFTGYTIGGFDQAAQLRLKDLCDELHKNGIKFLLSNSATDFIKDLYKDYVITLVKAKRMINSKVTARGSIAEALIKNY